MTVTGSLVTIHVTLAAGHSVKVTFTAKVSATDTTNVKNTAVITTGPCIAPNHCTSTVTNPVPNFTVKKTDVPGTGKPVVPGSTIPYTITVKNTGSGAGSAVLGDTIASNLAITAATLKCATVAATDACTATVTGAQVTIHVTLAAGHSVKVTFTAKVSATDTTNVKNTAVITTGPCIAPNHCTSTVTNPVPNFTVKKTDVPGTGKPVVPGSTIPYTITVKNTGSGAGSAVLGDTIASNLAITAATLKCATVAATDACTATVTGAQVTIHVTLAAGHSVKVTFTAKVSATDTTNVKNTAVITTGPCIAPNHCTSTVTNPVPNFTVKKTNVPGTGKPVVPGSTIPYTITVKNTGSGAGSAVLGTPWPRT